MATKLYGNVLPEKFGTLGDSFSTMFQLMTMEDWTGGIVQPVMEQEPWAWLFFIPFIIISTFVVLNLVIGVIVESIQGLKEQREAALRAEQRAESQGDTAQVLAELRASLERADISGWPPGWAVSDRPAELWAATGDVAFPLARTGRPGRWLALTCLRRK